MPKMTHWRTYYPPCPEKRYNRKGIWKDLLLAVFYFIGTVLLGFTLLWAWDKEDSIRRENLRAVQKMAQEWKYIPQQGEK